MARYSPPKAWFYLRKRQSVGTGALGKGRTRPDVSGQGGANVPGTGGGGYQFVNAEAAALVARFATQPNDARKALIDGRFTAGKAKSFWAKTAALWVHAAHGAEAGRLDWLNRFGDGRYDCQPINSPAFEIDRGYMGNGSDSYLDTGFNAANTDPLFTQNSGALAIRSNTANVGTGSLAGFYDSANNRGSTINPRIDNTNSVASYRLNTGASGATSPSSLPINADSIGMYVASRTAANDLRGYKNGTLLVTGAQASVVLANGNIRLGSINNTSYRACQFSMGGIFSGLTDQEVQDLFDWFEPYRIAVGVV